MSPDITHRFRQGYFYNPAYKRIFRILDINNKVKNATRVGVDFKLIKGFLYYVAENRTRRLYVFKTMQDFILTMAHNNQYHTGLHKTLRHLNGFHFRHKRKLVKAWICGYQACVLNQIDRYYLPGEMQPIRTPKTPMHTITINWILILPIQLSIGIPWALPEFSSFDYIIIVTNKYTKRYLLIPRHLSYTTKYWATVLIRILILLD